MGIVDGPDHALPHLGRHQTLQEVVYDNLRRLVLDGTLRPGQRIRQDVLATQLGVSTMPIRVALKRLEAEGLVIISPRRGTMVSQLRADEAAEIFLLRKTLESLAAQLAVPELTPADLDGMRSILNAVDEATTAGDNVAFLRLDRQFHFMLYEATKKPLLTSMISALWDRSDVYRRASVYGSERVRKAQGEHWQILEACERGDADGAAQMTAVNLERTARELAERFGAGTELDLAGR